MQGCAKHDLWCTQCLKGDGWGHISLAEGGHACEATECHDRHDTCNTVRTAQVLGVKAGLGVKAVTKMDTNSLICILPALSYVFFHPVSIPHTLALKTITMRTRECRVGAAALFNRQCSTVPEITWQDGAVDADGAAVVDKLCVALHTVEQLGHDEVSASLNLHTTTHHGTAQHTT